LLAISLGRDQDARANFMNERYIKWYTPYLSRDFEMLVFGEKSWLPFILFPTSGARCIGSTMENGAGMIGITGATCCHIICRKCEAPVLSHFINLELFNLSFRAEFRRAKHSRGISNCF
jgi:esterase/lipase superfamily enzyme